MKQKIIQAVVLAGGYGKRLGKLTTNIPKPLLKFKKKSFLLYIVDELKKAEINNIIILAGFKGDQIDKIFKKNKGVKVLKEKFPLGTGGSLINAKKYLKRNFILLNGDSYINTNLKYRILSYKNKFSKLFIIKNHNYKSNKLLSNLYINYKNKIKFSKKYSFMYSGLSIIKKSILKNIKLENFSLEEKIFPALIKKNNLEGEIINSKFIDIGTRKNYTYAKKNIEKIFEKKCVFFDRDNTLIVDKGYTFLPKDLKWMPGAIKTIQYLNKKNYLVIVITNQAGVAKGYYTENHVKLFHKHMNKVLYKHNAIIDDFFYCPFHPKGKGKFKKNTKLRKPGNLMIKNSIKKWKIDIKNSFFIGDTIKDEVAARKTGLEFYYVSKDQNLFSLTKNILKKYES